MKKEISLYKGAEMTETEIKSMIDKDLYESILNAFTWEKVREQTNYYYTDKAGILRAWASFIKWAVP